MDLFVYRIRLATLGPVTFPAFPVPALRGALGEDRDLHAALLDPAVLLPQRRFEDPPRPLLLRPSFDAGTWAAGSALELALTLAGRAARALPLLVRALVRLGAAGVGAARYDGPGAGCFEVERMDALTPDGAVPVVHPGGAFTPVAVPWRVTLPAPDPRPGSLRLHLVSPTFVRRGDQPRGSLAFADLVDETLKRLSLLAQAYGDGPPLPREAERAWVEAARGVAARDHAVRWCEVPRHSRRQGRSMVLEGWRGWVDYAADPQAWAPLLTLASLVHVGRHTSFGFGHLRVAPEDATDARPDRPIPHP